MEPKLRDLKDGEADIGAMQKAYKAARSEFTPRGGRIARVAEQPAPPPKPAPVEEEPELDDDFDDDLDTED